MDAPPGLPACPPGDEGLPGREAGAPSHPQPVPGLPLKYGIVGQSHTAFCARSVSDQIWLIIQK